MQDKNTIRAQIRRTRRNLTKHQQKKAAFRLTNVLKTQPLFLYSRRIAFYLPNDGEIDPGILIAIALRQYKRCYLPVLMGFPKTKMAFVEYQKGKALKKNRFGILEPAIKKPCLNPRWQLDLALMPLVAFDIQGHRLGMGGGFYDRAFAFKKNSNTRPILIGVAHSCQEVKSLHSNQWDVHLDAIATDNTFRLIR